MQNVLKYKKVDFVLNEAVILDYFVSALWWAGKEQKFTKEQISAFYTVISTLLDNIRGTEPDDDCCIGWLMPPPEKFVVILSFFRFRATNFMLVMYSRLN